ncbi:hypothetical protein ACJO2E_08375 [Marinobacter sp. M1N3S26]|uniref:hypothetical protein n=1 Tax=unclassified Marinobacter TaxID=83889 RepID=UPI00387ACFFD
MKVISIGMRLILPGAFVLFLTGCSITSHMGPPEGGLENLEFGKTPSAADTVNLAKGWEFSPIGENELLATGLGLDHEFSPHLAPGSRQ